MRRLLAGVLVLGACAAALVATGAGGDSGKNATYKIVFDNAFGLVEGGDFRVGGVRAGKTSEFEVQKRPGRAPKAVVTATIDQPGFDDFRDDASCEIRQQSLIGEYFVDCQTGSSPQKLRRRTVPVTQTASTIPTDLVNNIMRRPVRERFRLILTELGTALAGRPRDLQQVLRRAHPGLRETTRVLKILGDQNRVIENFIRDSDTVIRELEANKRDVVRWAREAGDAAEISATRREGIRQSFRRLPTFLAELRPTMARLGELADAQVPLLSDLERAAPHLNVFFRRLGPFSDASRPAFRSLGRASRAGTRAIREGTDEVRQLGRIGREAPPTFRPLRQYLQTIDDRRRAIENDPRAVEGAPPRPDPTAIRAGRPRGFPGMEAFWNYYFWQSLSINGFDEVGHLLRVAVTEIGDCGDIVLNREEVDSLPDECKQWLGPNQPGITTADPTENTRSARRVREQSGRPARRVGERRGEGEPEAGPVPGQRDMSRPQVTLPPQLQQLLDHLRGAPSPREGLERGNRALRNGDAENQLLDYLLAP